MLPSLSSDLSFLPAFVHLKRKPGIEMLQENYSVFRLTLNPILQCTGVVTKEKSTTDWCCLVIESEILYRKPGNMILYYKQGTPVYCLENWAGKNCDSCA